MILGEHSGSNKNFLTIKQDITLNEWHFFSRKYNGNTGLFKIRYYDKFNQTTIEKKKLIKSSGVDPQIGGLYDASENSHYSHIDEFSLYSKKITDKTIDYIYKSKKALFYEQIIPKGIKEIDISSCNLTKGNQYNLITLTKNQKIEQTFIAK